MHNVKKEALIMMIRDYAAEKKYELQYDYDRFEEYTTFYVNREAHTIVWDHFDNIYKAFDMFIESVEKKQKPEVPRQIYLATARGSGKSVVKEIFDYCCNDVELTRKTAGSWGHLIKDVIFNDPATIVFWMDGSKTVVKCQDDEYYDAEKGLAMAITKKFLGNQGNYYNEIKKWLEKYEATNLVGFKINNPFKFSIPKLNYPRDIIDSLIKAATTTRPRKLNLYDKFDDDVKEIIDEGRREKKKETAEKIDKLITGLGICVGISSESCTNCDYYKGDNMTFGPDGCTATMDSDIVKYLTEYRDLLTKEDT